MAFLPCELANVKLPTSHPLVSENTVLERHRTPNHLGNNVVICQDVDSLAAPSRDPELAVGSPNAESNRRLLRNRAARWFVQHIVGRQHARRKLHDLGESDGSDHDRGPPSDTLLHITSEDIIRNRAQSRRVTLNVGGEHHEVLWKTLERIPNSRLGRLSTSVNPGEILRLCDEYVPEKNEFYFDRSARTFSAVLGLYRTGHFHIQEDVCVLALKEDLTYWGISEHLMDVCCLHRYYQKEEQMDDEIKKTHEIYLHQAQEEQFGSGKLANLKRKIWDLVEKPQTSMAARVFAVISITFILLSIIGLNLSTIPELRVNITHINDTPASLMHEDSHLVINPKLETLELVCTIWFTFELVVRFSVTPNKWTFAKSPLNLIDVLAILPFYFSKIFEFWLNSTVESLVSMRKVVQMFRILRILRVFKLARHSQGLQALGYTLAHSYKELGLLMTFVMLVVLLFSSLAYFAEKDENDMFTSIPATYWWAIITMTTVGYGDITPRTVLGKVIGSVCCICGVIVVGLPIPIIVNNFAAFYQEQTRREKVMKHQEATKTLCLMDSLYRKPGVTTPAAAEARAKILLSTKLSNKSPSKQPASTSAAETTASEAPTSPSEPASDFPDPSSLPLFQSSAASHEISCYSPGLDKNSIVSRNSKDFCVTRLMDEAVPQNDTLQQEAQPNNESALSDHLPLLIISQTTDQKDGSITSQ